MSAELESTELSESERALAASGNPNYTPPVESRDGSGQDATETPVEDASAAEEIGQPVKDDVSSGGGTEAATPTSWVTDEDREFAKSYGFSDEELSEFGSQSELRRAGRYIDRHLAAPFQPQQTPPPVPPTPPVSDTVSQKPVVLDPDKLKADGYDDELVNAVKSFDEEKKRILAERQQLEQQFNEYRQAQAQVEARRLQDQIDGIFDRLEESRYGRRTNKDGSPRQLTAKEAANRQKANQEAETIAAGYLARYGDKVPQVSLEAMIRRGENAAFADEIRAQERQRMAAQVAEQSKRRRPAAGHKTPRATNGQFTNAKPATIREAAAQLSVHPEIVKAWNKATGAE